MIGIDEIILKKIEQDIPLAGTSKREKVAQAIEKLHACADEESASKILKPCKGSITKIVVK